MKGDCTNLLDHRSPGGKVLETLRDAGKFVARLPKASRSKTKLSSEPKCSKNQLFLIGEQPRETTLDMAMEIAMLFLFLPITIFDAMLPSPKRKGRQADGC
jgi:hypothetical protein